MNISLYPLNETAKTCIECANQRAENLYSLGVKNVIELCAGPSLKILETCYSKYGIQVTGNDIDVRYMKHYPNGNWKIGDCRNINLEGFDAIVYAPPLSLGCSGKRQDSLSISQVFPKYETFMNIPMLTIMVLPGRSMATKQDRKEFYELISKTKRDWELIPLKNKVIKYWDLYLK